MNVQQDEGAREYILASINLYNNKDIPCYESLKFKKGVTRSKGFSCVLKL